MYQVSTYNYNMQVKKIRIVKNVYLATNKKILVSEKMSQTLFLSSQKKIDITSWCIGMIEAFSEDIINQFITNTGRCSIWIWWISYFYYGYAICTHLGTFKDSNLFLYKKELNYDFEGFKKIIDHKSLPHETFEKCIFPWSSL